MRIHFKTADGKALCNKRSRAEFRATTNAAQVDCVQCLAKMPAPDATYTAAQMFAEAREDETPEVLAALRAQGVR